MRLIDADALEDMKCAVMPFDGMENLVYANGWNDAIEAIITNAPSARPTGEWTIQNEELKISDYRCSVCGHYQDIETNYCPNCGAKMGSDTR